MKSHFPVTYSVVRYAPFVETREFANIGIILISPRQGVFDYKLQTAQKHSRITSFFQPASVDLYRQALKVLRIELDRLKRGVGQTVPYQQRLDFGVDDPVRLLFHDLLRRREGVIRFSDPSSALTDDPKALLENLFARLVDRDFTAPVQRESEMIDEVRLTLQECGLDKRFVRTKIGDDLYQATFPFVQMDADSQTVAKIIKPFFLGQERPESIIDHSVSWSYRVRRLRDRGIIRKEVLFPVEGPPEGRKRREAYDEAIKNLEQAGGLVSQLKNKRALLDYADT